jgi:hypothetical protein
MLSEPAIHKIKVVFSYLLPYVAEKKAEVLYLALG